MKWQCLSLTTALLLAAGAAAEPPRGPDKPLPTQTVIKMTLHPAGPTEPALRYRLLPELRDRQPGNAAALYMRAFSPEWFIGGQIRNRMREDPDYDTKLEKWRTETPLKDFPLKDLEWATNSNDLREVDRAARRAYCDWELTDRMRQEGIGLLLPDVQSLRAFARFLDLRARAEIAQGKFGDAVHTLQTGLQLGRHASEGPTLIHGLVGIAVDMIMLQRLEELIQQPGAPNFYWPLTDLPPHLVDLRSGVEGERLTIDWLVPGGRELLANPNAPRPSPEKHREMLKGLAAILEEPHTPSAKLEHFEEKAAALPEARKVLKGYGWTDAQIDAIPGGLANTLLEIHNYDRYYDDMLVKWFRLPDRIARPQFIEADALLKAAKKGQPGMVLAALLLPATTKVMAARLRLDRRVAALRVVEALRLHAAGHDGKLPASLADITEVPVPDDPATGKPFEYTLEGERAVLLVPAPPGDKPNMGNNLRYELTIAR
jgi:hypothetical protein